PRLAERRAAREHVEGGVAGPLRIVLVSGRRAEDREGGVAYEFFHEAVVARDRLGERLEQGVLERAYHLGIEALGHPGEAGEIGEEDGDLSAVGLPAGGGRCLRRRRRPRAQRHPAPGAEREVGPALGAAREAGARQPVPAPGTEGEARRGLGA